MPESVRWAEPVYRSLFDVSFERGLADWFSGEKRIWRVIENVDQLHGAALLEMKRRRRLARLHLWIVPAHSGLGEAARARGFLDALEGRADIVLGTRLSVFMPLPRLSLIVVDEEHDASFKQQDGLRYSARDLAVFRAHAAGVPVVLGSATPSLESYYHAKSGRYALLELPSRALA